MNDPLESLERLSRLRDSGALTEVEFQAEKARMFGTRSSGGADPARANGRDDASVSRRGERWIRTRRGKATLATALLLLLAAASGWWWFSPYWTLRNMQSALAARDADAFSAYVDFESLRSDLKADAFAEIAKESRASNDDESDGFAMLGAAMVGPMIDGMISPNGVRALFAMKKPDGRDFGMMDAARGGGEVVRTGLSEFQVKGAKGDVLIYSLNGLRWQLSGLDPAPDKVGKAAVPVPPPLSDSLQSNAGTEFAAPVFSCPGTYSNVDFSSESGDGSGVLAKIREDGDVTMTFWEGGAMTANVVTTSFAPNRLDVKISFDEFSGETSTGSLTCSGNAVAFKSGDLGHNATLRRISAAQEAELNRG